MENMEKVVLKEDEEREFFIVEKIEDNNVVLQNIKDNKKINVEKEKLNFKFEVGTKVFEAKQCFYLLEETDKTKQIYSTLQDKYVLFKKGKNAVMFVWLFDNFSCKIEPNKNYDCECGTIFVHTINKDGKQSFDVCEELEGFLPLKSNLTQMVENYDKFMFDKDGALSKLVEDEKDFKVAKKNIKKYLKIAIKQFNKIANK